MVSVNRTTQKVASLTPDRGTFGQELLVIAAHTDLREQTVYSPLSCLGQLSLPSLG